MHQGCAAPAGGGLGGELALAAPLAEGLTSLGIPEAEPAGG